MPRLQAPEAPYTPSEAPKDVVIVRLGAPTGSNNFNSVDADGIERLVELPAKIRKMTLASRGMFAFVQLFEQSDSRVAGEVTHVITSQEIKSWRKSGEWYVHGVLNLRKLIPKAHGFRCPAAVTTANGGH